MYFPPADTIRGTTPLPACMKHPSTTPRKSRAMPAVRWDAVMMALGHEVLSLQRIWNMTQKATTACLPQAGAQLWPDWITKSRNLVVRWLPFFFFKHLFPEGSYESIVTAALWNGEGRACLRLFLCFALVADQLLCFSRLKLNSTKRSRHRFPSSTCSRPSVGFRLRLRVHARLPSYISSRLVSISATERCTQKKKRRSSHAFIWSDRWLMTNLFFFFNT